MGWRLYCPRCGWEGAEEEYHPYCPRCGSPLEIRGEIDKPKHTILGEGNTPLVREEFNNLHYKLEYLNPTGSFKDRGVALSVWLAKRLGYKCVTVDSSGNTALSTAAYSRRLGLYARIHAPINADISKLKLIKALGAKLYLHDSRNQATNAAKKEKDECYYIAHQYSPIFLEGISSLGEELVRDDAHLKIVLPVSSGSLLLGVVRGIKRYNEKPMIIAVQSTRAPWLRKYIRPRYEDIGSSRLLDALVVEEPPRQDEASTIVNELLIVGDKSVKILWKRVFDKGFIVEPSSASVYAAVEFLHVKDATLILTGSGLKYHHKLDNIL